MFPPHSSVSGESCQEMCSIPAAIQGLLTLLGSSCCAPSHRHVVSVHHEDGRVERHPTSAPAPASTLLRWKLFPHSVKPISAMKFNEIRTEATRTLQYFISDPIPWPKVNCECFCSVPDFWLTSVPVASLPQSAVAVLRYHGGVTDIRLQDILPWGQVQPFKTNPKDAVRLATRSFQKSFLIAIIEVSRSIIGRTKENGHVDLPEVTMETMRQCDALLQDWQEEDEDDISDNDDIEIHVSEDYDFVNDNCIVVEHNHTNDNMEEQEEEEEWDGPFTQPDPVSTATADGLTSSYITPVLAGYLLDSSLGLHLLPSYFQVVLHDHLQLWLSDGTTVVQASLAPELLEELADVRLLHSVISVEESTGHAGTGNLVLVSLSIAPVLAFVLSCHSASFLVFSCKFAYIVAPLILLFLCMFTFRFLLGSMILLLL